MSRTCALKHGPGQVSALVHELVVPIGRCLPLYGHSAWCLFPIQPIATPWHPARSLAVAPVVQFQPWPRKGI